MLAVTLGKTRPILRRGLCRQCHALPRRAETPREFVRQFKWTLSSCQMFERQKIPAPNLQRHPARRLILLSAAPCLRRLGRHGWHAMIRQILRLPKSHCWTVACLRTILFWIGGESQFPHRQPSLMEPISQRLLILWRALRDAWRLIST